MVKNLIIGLLLFLLLAVGAGFYVSYSNYSRLLDISKKRVDKCQELLTEVDTLLAEVTTDYDNFMVVWADYFAGDISTPKLEAEVTTLIDSKSNIPVRYQSAIDKYKDDCFGLE